MPPSTKRIAFRRVTIRTLYSVRSNFLGSYFGLFFYVINARIHIIKAWNKFSQIGEWRNLMSSVSILIVEDDEDLSNIMRGYLSNEDYEIVQAYSGTEAVAKAEQIDFQLILLDSTLPELEGIEVCRRTRSHSYCPIVMISAEKSDSDKLLALGIGADDYITKPFSLLELV